MFLTKYFIRTSGVARISVRGDTFGAGVGPVRGRGGGSPSEAGEFSDISKNS